MHVSSANRQVNTMDRRNLDFRIICKSNHDNVTVVVIEVSDSNDGDGIKVYTYISPALFRLMSKDPL